VAVGSDTVQSNGILSAFGWVVITMRLPIATSWITTAFNAIPQRSRPTARRTGQRHYRPRSRTSVCGSEAERNFKRPLLALSHRKMSAYGPKRTWAIALHIVLLTQSGRPWLQRTCPLSGAKRHRPEELCASKIAGNDFRFRSIGFPVPAPTFSVPRK